jgi:uncharacterized membrane protein
MLNLDIVYSTLRRWLPYLYLLFAIPIVCATALITPPFQSPDEPNHFARAEQVSRFEIVPAFIYDKAGIKADTTKKDPRIAYPDMGGFMVDKAVYQLDDIYRPLARNDKVKINSINTDSAKKLRWGRGIINFNFGNTAIYPPVVYIMQAAGVGIGKVLHLGVLHTLYLARLLNGAFCITLSFLALLLAKRSNTLMFVVLFFPMTISLFASLSQDAVLISCCFLLAALIDDMVFGGAIHRDNRKFYLMILLISIIGIAKPPYILFVFLLLFLNISPKQKVMAIIIPFVILACWLVIDHGAYIIKFAPPQMRLNSKLQVAYILHHPFKFIGMFFVYDKIALINVAHMFVGVLGWLDLQFTDIYYRNAYICLFLGALVTFGVKGNIRMRIALLICSIATLIAVISAQYVTWTALEAPALGGMQGRYLIPVFPFLALAISGYPVNMKLAGIKTILLSAVLLFPVYTAVVMIKLLLNRYY